jgi:AraC-like DNA-binding protein
VRYQNMEIAGIGRVIFWTGGSLWIGRALAPGDIHAHHAIQIGIGLSDGVQFRTAVTSPWQDYEAAYVPPDAAHAFAAPGKMTANLFCEPESALGRALASRYGSRMIAAIPRADVVARARALRAAFEEGRPDEDLEQAALDTLYDLSGNEPATSGDQRIRQATSFIAARLAGPVTLPAVAEHVGLSSGRFRHLFVQETGISFRSYLLWTRLNRALELGFGGATWTDAAHATGFADSAHLSRTTRRMYGLSPTSIRQDASPGARRLTA